VALEFQPHALACRGSWNRARMWMREQPLPGAWSSTRASPATHYQVSEKTFQYFPRGRGQAIKTRRSAPAGGTTSSSGHYPASGWIPNAPNFHALAGGRDRPPQAEMTSSAGTGGGFIPWLVMNHRQHLHFRETIDDRVTWRFIDQYDPGKKINGFPLSIDAQGRYAYANQPGGGFALWNMNRGLAEWACCRLDRPTIRTKAVLLRRGEEKSARPHLRPGKKFGPPPYPGRTETAKRSACMVSYRRHGTAIRALGANLGWMRDGQKKPGRLQRG